MSLEQFYLISNNGNVVLMIPKDEFKTLFNVTGMTVKSKTGVYIDIDYYENCKVLQYECKPFEALGYFFLKDYY